MAIQVAVVGMGGRGQDWIREIRSANQFEIAACVDNDRHVLELARQKMIVPAERCFTDLRSALDRNGVNAVMVATPADCHVEPCEEAIARGLAVIVEKPFAMTLREAVDLSAKAEKLKTPLIVAQNYRYMRSFRTARKLISEGVLGPIAMVLMQYYRVPHNMAPSLARLPHSVLWGVGVHHLDALRYVVGKKIVRVLAEGFAPAWEQSLQGSSLHVMLELEEGTRAFYAATYDSSGHEFFEGGQEFYARFVGEKATLHVFQRWLILCPKGKLPRLIRRGERKISEEQVLLSQLERKIKAGEEPDSSGRDNLQTMAVVEACIRSATEQRWINPQELLNELEEGFPSPGHRYRCR
jgi:predicted dehydrogenase